VAEKGSARLKRVAADIARDRPWIAAVIFKDRPRRWGIADSAMERAT
jgi:hypothetical protein